VLTATRTPLLLCEEICAVYLIMDYISKYNKIIIKRNVIEYYQTKIPLYLYIMITNNIIREGISPRGFETIAPNNLLLKH
jgi:hypothetical protein